MTVETRITALSLAQEQMKTSLAPDSVGVLLANAAKIEEWIDGESPAEVRFADLRHDLNSLQNRLDQRDSDLFRERVRRADRSVSLALAAVLTIGLLIIGYLVWNAYTPVKTPVTIERTAS